MLTGFAPSIPSASNETPPTSTSTSTRFDTVAQPSASDSASASRHLGSRPAGLALWWQAIRPRTLGLSVSPVMAGLAAAVAQPEPIRHPWVALVIVIGVLAIQAGTNLFNDAADFLNGTDQKTRLGPPRVTERGWATPHQVLWAGRLAFLVSVLAGLVLVLAGGWPIAALGAASLVAGYGYSRGPWPLSRTPLGEGLVVAFFGIGAVAGTVFLLTGTVSMAVVGLGAIVGLPAAAVLLVNNIRDHEDDRRAGRLTLAILLGPVRARRLYAVLVLAPFASLPLLAVLEPALVGSVAGSAVLPLALWLAIRLQYVPIDPGLNRILGWTVCLQLALVSLAALGLAALGVTALGLALPPVG